jgi:ABC-type lipoprotein export system ATPase subunit
VTTAPMLLLDEPTSQQDESSVARVVAVLRDEVTGGRGILAASHDPRFVAEAAESVALRLGATPVIAGRRDPAPAAGPRDTPS